MNLKYDLHTHILQGVDDGAQTVEDSLTLINALNQQGIENICLTPHFYSHKEDMEGFLARRNLAFEELRPHLPDGINIKLGAEVYVTKYLFSEERDLTKVCIEGTPYMITEFSYQTSFSESKMNMIRRIMDFGIIPVIPHVERYPALLKHKDLLEELRSMGVVIQSNLASYTDGSYKRKLVKLVNSGVVDVLSSDVHSLDRNSPVKIPDALGYITKKCSADYISDFNTNAKLIFEGKEL